MLCCIAEAGTASHLGWTWLGSLGLAGMHAVPYDMIAKGKGKGKGKRGVGVWDHWVDMVIWGVAGYVWWGDLSYGIYLPIFLSTRPQIIIGFCQLTSILEYSVTQCLTKFDVMISAKDFRRAVDWLACNDNGKKTNGPMIWHCIMREAQLTHWREKEVRVMYNFFLLFFRSPFSFRHVSSCCTKAMMMGTKK